MTWSSSKGMPDTRQLTDSSDAPASSYAWTELEAAPLGPAAEAAAKVAKEEAHQREIEQAYQRGVADGQQAGAAIARKELQSAMHAILEALESVREQRLAWTERLREDLVMLAAAMASQVVEQKVSVDPMVFGKLTQKAVAAFPVEEPVRVRLHPTDLEVIITSGEAEDLTEHRSVRWVPDEDTVRGGCIVEGPDKIVDGRVDEALRRLIRELTHD